MRYTVILEKESDGASSPIFQRSRDASPREILLAEALANIREAAELYIEECLEAGDPVPTEAGRECVELMTNA